ncbi:MAG: insulinase family protein, partial [Clostridia bacterium]|nr:insulinase family protein [Clostridia bacterium]
MREISYKTKNGINIYGIKNPAQHGFYISLFLRAGIMYEAADEVGITHFLEHILIRNVNRVMNGRLYETCDRYGIEFNASTYAEMV